MNAGQPARTKEKKMVTTNWLENWTPRESKGLTSQELAQLEKDEFLKSNIVVQNSSTDYEPVIIAIQVGMPATYYVGSDSYATEVSAVNYFKSGNRAGQIKSVEVRLFGETSTFRPKFYSSGVSWVNEYRSLGLGYARQYLDPSF
jgi:hypothetical protein